MRDGDEAPEHLAGEKDHHEEAQEHDLDGDPVAQEARPGQQKVAGSIGREIAPVLAQPAHDVGKPG